MKSDYDHKGNSRISRRFFLFPALLFLCSLSYAQVQSLKDSLQKINFKLVPPDPARTRFSFISTRDSLSYSGIIPPSDPDLIRTEVFLDSLKILASKTIFTRKLYDFVITPQPLIPRKEINRSAEAGFTAYSGFKIRKIEIKQLNVFGSNINFPNLSQPNKIENILNKTHINTNEKIIRKNLLFSEGDTISPLTISDNERLLRQLPFIDDSRILIVPVSGSEADVIIFTKDVYSLGADANFSGIKKGSVSVYEKNIFGMGHEFDINVPYDSKFSDSPGFGVNYRINNISKTFLNLDIYYLDGLGKKTYGFDLTRNLVSFRTKYAGGISLREMFTSEDLDSLINPAPVKYNLQDYWIQRSFLIDESSVTRIILGARYTNNNVFDHPFILPDSYHYLQRFKMILGSATFSVQKYYKTNLIYSYGRTEDIPYGGLFNITAGSEINEFKKRMYVSGTVSIGESIKSLGYFYGSSGFGTFLNNGQTEQGILSLKSGFVSNLNYIGRFRHRIFLKAEYIRGFDRYSDENLYLSPENGFSGFRNDSLFSQQRLSFSLESVLFSPANFYGFRSAFFLFADLGILFGTNQFAGSGDLVSAIGAGIRVRNDNLVFKTLQIRIGFFPNPPDYSRINYFLFSGEQLLRPNNFDPVKPSIIQYR